METCKEVPRLAGDEACRLYTMLHVPDAARRGSVVMCNPLFEERKSSHRALVEAARSLCRLGYLVIRFDYRGCGDSQGRFRDFSLADWEQDIAAMLALAAEEAPEAPLGLLGVRAGGAMALRVGARDARVGFVAAWEPVVNGETYLRAELRKKLMKEMVTFGKGTRTRDTWLHDLEQGRDVDLDGYPVSPALAADLRTLDLIQAPSALGKPFLVVAVGPSAASASVHTQLRDTLSTPEAAGDTRSVDCRPFWNLIGYTDITPLVHETATWMDPICRVPGVASATPSGETTL